MYTLTISGKELPVSTRGDLANLSTLELVLAYNHLTGKAIKGFHTRTKGEEQIWSLLTQQTKAVQPKQGGTDMAVKTKSTKKSKRSVKVKASHGKAKSQTNGEENPKCAEPKEVKRETARMLLVIRKVKEHPGKGLRVKRWARYRDGMTIKKVIEMENGDPRDINFFVQHKLMKLEKPSAK